MYRDNTLIPSEAIRLLALGLLATQERPYAQLAGEVRHFVGHVVGPSLDLIGTPIEVLKVEGLVEAAGAAADDKEPALRITDPGRAELRRLLASNVRAPVNDINRLIITLKMRFLHLLDAEERRLQIEILIEMCERQLVRLTELLAHHGGAPGHLTGWLEHEIDQIRQRLAWFQALEAAEAAAALSTGADRQLRRLRCR